MPSRGGLFSAAAGFVLVPTPPAPAMESVKNGAALDARRGRTGRGKAQGSPPVQPAPQQFTYGGGELYCGVGVPPRRGSLAYRSLPVKTSGSRRARLRCRSRRSRRNWRRATVPARGGGGRVLRRAGARGRCRPCAGAHGRPGCGDGARPGGHMERRSAGRTGGACSEPRHCGSSASSTSLKMSSPVEQLVHVGCDMGKGGRRRQHGELQRRRRARTDCRRDGAWLQHRARASIVLLLPHLLSFPFAPCAQGTDCSRSMVLVMLKSTTSSALRVFDEMFDQISYEYFMNISQAIFDKVLDEMLK